MSDIAANYVITSPGGAPDIAFNNGELGTSDDIWYLTNVTGLEAEIRAPKDKVPVGHGAKLHNFWEDGLEPKFEGIYLIQSTRRQDLIRELRNQMHRQLKECLRACFDTDGTLTWSEPEPGGPVDYSLGFQYEIKLVPGYDANWTVKTFSFGLASEASVPSVV